MPSRRMNRSQKWHRRESNPQTRRFEVRRSASWRTVPESYGVAVRRGATTVFAPHADSTGDNQNASPTGFEPVISTVTGWRALQTAPRGRVFSLQVAQVGLDPTASLRPTLRVGARAKVVCQLPTEPSCVPQAGFEPATARRPRSTAVPDPCRFINSRTRASSPGWTRTTDRHLVRVLPSPLGHGTALLIDHLNAEADHGVPRCPDSNSQAAHRRHLFSRQAPHPAGSLPFVSVAGVGVEPTSRRSECLVLPLDDPAVVDLRKLVEKDLNLHSPRPRLRRGARARRPTVSRSPKNRLQAGDYRP